MKMNIFWRKIRGVILDLAVMALSPLFVSILVIGSILYENSNHIIKQDQYW
jgi:hypothetical protein